MKDPIYEKLIELKSSYLNTYRDLEVRRDGLKTEIAYCTQQVALADTAVKDLNEVVQILTEKEKSNLEHLITRGIQRVFGDRHEWSVEWSGKDRMCYALRNVTNDRLDPVDDGFGGGIKELAAFIFRIYFIFRFRLNRFLMLDECFSQINGRRIKLLSSYLNEFCLEYGFIMLLISHDSEFLEFVDFSYHAVLGKDEVLYIEE